MFKFKAYPLSQLRANLGQTPVFTLLRFLSVFFAASLLTLTPSFAQTPANAGSNFANIGRPATASEIKAWDIDVRPDFLGLPKGSGTAAKGTDIWEAKCASCHGSFGEANNIFSPLIGGTTKNDIKTGRVASLTDNSYPGRTTMMKVATLSTLWDYINRAMPWNQPKSLSSDEVYTVLAYMLHTADVIPENYVLSHETMAQVQQLLPNRNGMTTNHALWPGSEFKGTAKPDVTAKRCMSNCVDATTVASALPDYARNAHGNLVEQNRLVGPQRGQNTDQQPKSPTVGLANPDPIRIATVTAEKSGTAATASPTNETKAAPTVALLTAKDVSKILSQNSCSACHGMDTKLVGPSFKEIAAKYSKKNSAPYLEDKIKKGSAGVWGAIPMPAQGISDDNAKLVARWLAQ
jgi:S-disulfanyl-L-cysteine oxidoreductase SoxD